MKIAVFGANGKTGIEIVKQGLAKGYQVNAFVRDPNSIQLVDPLLTVFTGDVLLVNTFEFVLEEVDVVLTALDGIMGEGIKNILEGMRVRHVRKIIHMSSYPMSGSPQGMKYLKSAGIGPIKLKKLMPNIDDKKVQEALITESGLTWTIVRPTFLRDEPKTGKYKTEENIQFDAKIHGVNRADVAEFMINAVGVNEWDNKMVSISS